MTRENRERLQITKWTWVLFAAVLGAGIVWVWLQASWAWGWQLPRFPIAAALIFIAITLAGLLLVIFVRRRIQNFRTHAPSLLALGKSLVIAGGVLSGGYLVLAISNLRWEATIPRETFTAALVSLIAALICIISGYLLQLACRVPPEDDAD
jgi:FtsH-binding integral membrane protein